MVARFSETLPTTDQTPVLAPFPDFSPRIKSRYLHIFLICNLFIPPLMCPKKLKWHSFMGEKNAILALKMPSFHSSTT